MRYSVFLYVLCVTAMVHSKHKLVVMSFGGLRLKYIEEYSDLMPNVYNLYNKSARPSCLQPVFPTKTSVNHFSIATGLYAEDHGIISDCQYDEPIGQCKYERYDQVDESITPLWIENELQTGGISGVLNWSGADQEYKKKKPRYYQKFEVGTPIKDQVDKIFEWLQDRSQPANFVMAHFGELDKAVHENPADSDQVKTALKLVDTAVEHFFDKLRISSIELTDINVIIIGSQGAYSVKSTEGIELEDILSQEICTFVAMGSNALVTPNPGQLDTVLTALERKAGFRYNYYKKDDIPPEFRLNKLALLNDTILLVAKKTYFFWNAYLKGIQQNSGQQQGNSNLNPGTFLTGLDGYPANSQNFYMYTFFMATGPSFNPNKSPVSHFETVDIHPLIKELLGLSRPTSDRQSLIAIKKQVRDLLTPTAEDVTPTEKPLVESKDDTVKSMRSPLQMTPQPIIAV